jgi:hypothetical protein
MRHSILSSPRYYRVFAGADQGKGSPAWVGYAAFILEDRPGSLRTPSRRRTYKANKHCEDVPCSPSPGVMRPVQISSRRCPHPVSLDDKVFGGLHHNRMVRPDAVSKPHRFGSTGESVELTRAVGFQPQMASRRIVRKRKVKSPSERWIGCSVGVRQQAVHQGAAAEKARRNWPV